MSIRVLLAAAVFALGSVSALAEDQSAPPAAQHSAAPDPTKPITLTYGELAILLQAAGQHAKAEAATEPVFRKIQSQLLKDGVHPPAQ
jgi:hypothetical protein